MMSSAGDSQGILPTVPEGAEAVSLFGAPLKPQPLSPESRKALEERLAQAEADLEKDPKSADALIWVGRRTAYLGRFRDAIRIFSQGIAEHPTDPRFLRHRGHRYISIREFGRAAVDLERAAKLIEGKPDEVEPDGIPNAKGVPTSTLHFNVYYHLGLAKYLNGDFEGAMRAYRECLMVSGLPDRLVATGYWAALTAKRLGNVAELARSLDSLPENLSVIENAAYYRLLLMFKGTLTENELLEGAKEGNDPPTVGCGVAAWRLLHGRKEEAEQLLRKVLAGSQWAAFGYIAAEAEMKRMGLRPE